MGFPTSIAAWEELGRGVYSGRYARRCRRNRIPVKVFLERLGKLKISVDRLTIAPLDEADDIAAARSVGRDGDFHGWAVVAAEAAKGDTRTVVASPILNENPYHADIVLPPDAAADREEQAWHAQQLADSSYWQERPQPI